MASQAEAVSGDRHGVVPRGGTGLALANQTGTAVYEGGTWKVGDVSFCQLLKLENNGTAPAACNG